MSWLQECKLTVLQVKSSLELISSLVCTCRPGTNQVKNINYYHSNRRVQAVSKSTQVDSPHSNGLLYLAIQKFDGKINDIILCDAILSVINRLLSIIPEKGFGEPAFIKATSQPTVVLNSFIKAINGTQIESDSMFFRKMQPVLKELCLGRNDPWIRHGQEEKSIIQPKDLFPKVGSYWEPLPGFYSVELGNMPMRYCLLHGGAYHPWGLLNVTKHIGEIRHAPMRDHLAANHQVALNEWIFAFDRFTFQDEDMSVLMGGKGFAHTLLINIFIEVFLSYRNLFIVLGRFEV